MKDKIKIVIADDNATIRQTLRDILTEKGYLAEEVKNGYELLVYLKEQSPQIVILDLMMPEKDGLEVFSAIKCIIPDVKVIVYTGFQKYEHSIYTEMADRFLLKSGNPEELLQAIVELI